MAIISRLGGAALAAEGGFRPYSATHAITVAVFLLASWTAAHIRRRLNEPQGARLDRFLGVATLIVWLAYRIYVWMPGVRDLAYSLPLQMCDVTGLLAPVALLTRWRPARAILYFWGIGLSTLAFITPDLHEGPGDPRFWLFWLSHSAIVGAAIYDVAGRGFWPGWRDCRTALVAATAYAAVVLTFDVLSGFNYGYVGRSRPDQPPILDALGPWPGRVLVECALVAVVLALLVLPWELARRAREERSPSVEGPRPR